MVHLVGPVGSGKTAVLEGLLARAGAPEAADAAVLGARCLDHTVVQSSERGVIEELVVRVVEGVRAIEVSRDEEAGAPTDAEVPWLLPGTDFLAAVTSLSSLPDGARNEGSPDRAQVYADLLLDVARDHPVLLAVDDAQRMDEPSRRLVEALCAGVEEAPAARLLLVIASAEPLRDPDAAPAEAWRPAPGAIWPVPLADPPTLTQRVEARLARYGEPDPDFVRRVVEAAAGNPLVSDALVDLAERGGGLRGRRGPVGDADLESRPGYRGLLALGRGEIPAMPANVRADLQAAAVLGPGVDVELLASLWQVPQAAAQARVNALCATGLVAHRGAGRFAFLSTELVAHLHGTLPTADRASLDARAARLLRAAAPPIDPEPRGHPDVTETWSETRRRDRRLRDALERLWSAARHFARAGRHAAAAEAAITFAERLFDGSGSYLYLVGRFGRREDRAHRYRLYAALTEAGWRLDLAKAEPGSALDPELIAVEVRVLVTRARLKQVMGDFASARAAADSAVDLARHLADQRLRLEAVCARLEVCYNAGDHNAGRQSLAALLAELPRAPRDEAVRRYGWIAEAIARWEWPGLHDRLFLYVADQLDRLDAHREVIKARVERFTASLEQPPGQPDNELLGRIAEYAQARGESAWLAELLALEAADLIQNVVEAHYDSLSGEFYPPDLADEGFGPRLRPLRERLEPLCVLPARADAIAATHDQRVARLRVLNTTLGVIYETRERFAWLLDRWLPEFAGGPVPVRLQELLDVMEHGFFDLENIEDLTNQTILLARKLELDQVLADTIYDALDRDLPTAARRSGSLFEVARTAYERVGDAYGLITLALVEIRYQERSGESSAATLEAARTTLQERASELSAEQRAFVHQRFGELLLGERRRDAATGHLEEALSLYDAVGDMEHLHRVGDALRDLYRDQGDLGRYRALRERFRALDRRTPGFDPLGLESRIEHLLTLARQSADDEAAIQIVERCVDLFRHMPDGTTRIDECFVEISKICRRRADEAATEEGFLDWRRRSLDAVRTAAQINLELGNYRRLFEEHYELFDDLMALGQYEDYLRARAASRQIAFEVGDVAELFSLFEEHLQYDPDEGYDFGRLPEVRGFYEGMVRYLLGLGATREAEGLRDTFARFLLAAGFTELADHYRLSES